MRNECNYLGRISAEYKTEHYIDSPNTDISAKLFRKIILERDNYQCQCKCGTCEGKYDLQIHHIIPSIDGGSNDFENLITLCRTCHIQIETKLRRDYWLSR